MNIFRKNYTIRRHEKQEIVNGYASSPYNEFEAMLNVQPMNDDMQAHPEGDRIVRKVKSFGKDRITPADQYTVTQGDWLLYNGRWYECVMTVEWHATPLKHFYSEYTLVSEVRQ